MDFRPKLPANPFGDVPWVLDVDVLNRAQQTAVLVLNAPPPADLHALICASPALKHSLVLIATHQVPVLPAPASVLPTVRVLSLKGPLFDRFGALGLMSVLDKAARFASSPLATGGGIQIYSEDPVTGEFSIREEPGANRPETSIQHPALMLSTTSVATDASSSSLKKKRRTFNFFTSPSSSPASSPSPSLTSLPFLSSPPLPPPVPGSPSPTQHHASSRTGLTIGAARPFDTVIHFLPSPSQHLPEKAILKQAILVTTLSAPYLAAPLDPPKYLRLPQRMNTINKRGSKMVESRSMPRLRSTAGDTTMEADAFVLSPRTRKSTMALKSKQPSEQEQEDSVIESAGSTGSFKALKRKVTMSLRRKSSVAPINAAPEVDSGLREHGDEGKKEKRLSTLSRGGTQRRVLRKHSSTTRSSMLGLGADESGFLVKGEDDMTFGVSRYNGRSHVIHAVPLNTASTLVSSPPTSPNPNRNSAMLRSPPSPSPRHSTGKAKVVQKSSSKPMLVKSIEQFLIAFAYPVQSLGALSASATPPAGPSPTGSRTSSRSSSIVPSANASSVLLQPSSAPASTRSSVISVTGLGTSAGVAGSAGVGRDARSVPFILNAGALAASLSIPHRHHRHASSSPSEPQSHTLAEWVLFGGLDSEKEMGLSPKVWLDVDSAAAGSGSQIVCGGTKGLDAPLPVVVSFNNSTSAIGEASLVRETDGEGQSVAGSINESLRPSKPLDDRRASSSGKAVSPPRSSNLEPPQPTAPQLLTPESSVSSGSPPSPTTSSSPLSKVTDDNNQELIVVSEAKEQTKLRRSEVISDYRRYYHLPRPRPRSRSRSRPRSRSKERAQNETEDGQDATEGGEGGEQNRTGLLTPPDSESSSSEGGHEEDEEQQQRRKGSGREVVAPPGVRPTAATPEEVVEKEGNTSNTTTTTSSGAGSQHASFDSFVKAYMYDRGVCPTSIATAVDGRAGAAAEQTRTQVMGNELAKGGSTAVPPANRRDGRRLSASSQSQSRERSAFVEARGREPVDEERRKAGRAHAAFVGDIKPSGSGRVDVEEDTTRGGHDVPSPSRADSNERTFGDSGPPGDRGRGRNHGRLFDVTSPSRRCDSENEQKQGRSRSVSSGGRSTDGDNHEQGDGMGAKEAQEYANALRKYREDLFGGAYANANVDERRSIRNVGSVGSVSPSPAASNRGACSLAGVPPIVGGGGSSNVRGAECEKEFESEEVQMERWGKRQREKRGKRELEQERRERETTELKEKQREGRGSPLRHHQPHQPHYHRQDVVAKAGSSSEAPPVKYHYRKSIRRDEGRYNLAKDAEGPLAPQSPRLQEPKYVLAPALTEEGRVEKVLTPRERKSSLLNVVPKERKSSLNALANQDSRKRKSSPFGGLVGFGKALLGGSKAE